MYQEISFLLTSYFIGPEDAVWDGGGEDGSMILYSVGRPCKLQRQPAMQDVPTVSIVAWLFVGSPVTLWVDLRSVVGEGIHVWYYK